MKNFFFCCDFLVSFDLSKPPPPRKVFLDRNGISMAINQKDENLTRVYTSIHEYIQVHMSTSKYTRVYTSIHEYIQVYTSTCEYMWLSMNFRGSEYG